MLGLPGVVRDDKLEKKFSDHVGEVGPGWAGEVAGGWGEPFGLLEVGLIDVE